MVRGLRILKLGPWILETGLLGGFGNPVWTCARGGLKNDSSATSVGLLGVYYCLSPNKAECHGLTR